MAYPVRGAKDKHRMDPIGLQACDTCFTVKQLNQLFKQQRRPEELDLVVVEFAQNDNGAYDKDGFTEDYWKVVQCTEAMIRFFLELNPHVCIIYLEAWHHRRHPAQTLHSHVTVPYSIPVLSVRNALEHSGRYDEGRNFVPWDCSPVPMFPQNETRWPKLWKRKKSHSEEGYCYRFFWAGDHHPSLLGHKLLSDLLVHMMLTEDKPQRADSLVKEDSYPEKPLFGSEKMMTEMTNYVFLATSRIFSKVGQFRRQQPIKKMNFLTGAGWEYGNDKSSWAWQCHNCTSPLGLKFKLSSIQYTGPVCLIVGFKQSYERFGDFDVAATTEDLSGLKPMDATIVGKIKDVIRVKGIGRRRASVWVDTPCVMSWVLDSNQSRQVWVVFNPVIQPNHTHAGEIMINTVSVKAITT